MNDPLDAEIAERFRALGDPAWLRIIDHLRHHGEVAVKEIAAALGSNQQNTSKHLGVLRFAGIVARRKQGTSTLYRPADPSVLRLCDGALGRTAKARSAPPRQATGSATAPAVSLQPAHDGPVAANGDDGLLWNDSAMAGSGDHIKALLKSHAEGDDTAFYAVAGQIAAQEARRGHNRLASELKNAIEAAKAEPVAPRNVTPIARPRGDLADLVSASFPDVRSRDLVLPDHIKGQVQEVLAEQRQRRSLSERGFNPAHRLLLEGPPGTGKTMTASVLAHELSLPLLTVRLESVLSKFLGETAAKIRLVFDAVRDQRAVYLFDEFDALGADRSGNDIGEARRILNSFLVFLDQASAESIVIAATNHSSILDRALFRRFDMVIHYKLPDPKEARKVLRARLGSMAKGLRLDRLATSARVDGLSHAELVKVAEAAAKQALIRGDETISENDLVAALENRRSARHAVDS